MRYIYVFTKHTLPAVEIWDTFQKFWDIFSREIYGSFKVGSSDFNAHVVTLERPHGNHLKWSWPGYLSQPPSSSWCLQNKCPLKFSFSLENNQKSGLQGGCKTVLMPINHLPAVTNVSSLLFITEHPGNKFCTHFAHVQIFMNNSVYSCHQL